MFNGLLEFSLPVRQIIITINTTNSFSAQTHGHLRCDSSTECFLNLLQSFKKFVLFVPIKKKMAKKTTGSVGWPAQAWSLVVGWFQNKSFLSRLKSFFKEAKWTLWSWYIASLSLKNRSRFTDAGLGVSEEPVLSNMTLIKTRVEADRHTTSL